MFRNYFKTAFRSIVRHKAFSLINITGLAIGIAASLMLFMVVQYELGYDRFQKNYSRIYRVVTQDKFSSGITYNSGIPVPALEALRAEFPQIQFGAINSSYGSQITVLSSTNQAGSKFIENSGLLFCEPQLFQVFNYDWLAGDASVLKDPNTVVLSRKTAVKYFGNWQQAMGRTLLLDNLVQLKVSGIIQDVPANTDIPLEVLVSFETVKRHADDYGFHNDWHSTSSAFQIYALLPPPAREADIDRALLAFSNSHYKPSNLISIKTNFLQPLGNLHFDRRFDVLGNHVTAKATLLTLSLIGLFIVLMACVNFINLSTAMAVNRSKEVGIRKVLGGNRLSLFWQMMGETAVIVALSIILALGLVYFTLPYIKHIASIQESLHLFSLHNVIMLVATGASVTLLAGLYPSLVLSKFNPIIALKNKMVSAGTRGISLRRALVIMQFSISQVLIIATAVAVSQMDFINHADLGFKKEAITVMTAPSDSLSLAKQNAFKQSLLQIPGVRSASYCSDVPSSDNSWQSDFSFDHRPSEPYQVYLKFADADYLQTFGLQLVAGRNFEPGDTAKEILINETLVKKLGVKNAGEVVGKTIAISKGRGLPIAGVVKDFKPKSLREAIPPLLIMPQKRFYGRTAVQLRTVNIAAAAAAVQKVWEQYYPEYAYVGSFFDDDIAAFYSQEKQLSLLYKIFAGLAIFISCLGLYGLVSFMAMQKTKEVGIRKVLGASVISLVQLFSKEFTLLILLSFVIAAPVAWFMMHAWLNNFVYRISFDIGFFAVAIIGSMLIAWLSVGYKAIRTALANPVKSLRTE